MNVKTRQKIERRIVKQIVKSALAQGYSISIYNGGDEEELEFSVNATDIHRELFATDQDELVFHNNNVKRVGWVQLIYGNDGYDVICDYAANDATESVLKEAIELAEKLEDEYA